MRVLKKSSRTFDQLLKLLRFVIIVTIMTIGMFLLKSVSTGTGP